MHQETVSLICILSTVPRNLHYSPLREVSTRNSAWEISKVRQLQSGSCHYPTAATKCNVQIGNPARRTPINLKSLSPTKGCSAIYTPPFSYPPGNGKPHLHIIKRSTNVTLMYMYSSKQVCKSVLLCMVASTSRHFHGSYVHTHVRPYVCVYVCTYMYLC